MTPRVGQIYRYGTDRVGYYHIIIVFVLESGDGVATIRASQIFCNFPFAGGLVSSFRMDAIALRVGGYFALVS